MYALPQITLSHSCFTIDLKQYLYSLLCSHYIIGMPVNNRTSECNIIGDLPLLHTSIHKVWLTFLVRSSRPTLPMWPLGIIPKIANTIPYFKNMLRVLRVNFQEPQFWIGTHIRKFEILLIKVIFFLMVDLHTWYKNMCYGVLSFTYKRAHVRYILICIK